MLQIRLLTLHILIFLHCAGAFCATPEQAGTYVGKTRSERHSHATGERTTDRSTVTFVLNQDDSYSFQLVSSSGTGINFSLPASASVISPSTRVLHTAGGGTVFTVSIHFQKNGSIKGRFHITFLSVTHEGKFTLKKNVS